MKKRLIKTALSTGIPFGVIMGGYFGLDMGLLAGAISGLSCGAFFGITMAVFLEFQRRKMESTNKEFEGQEVLFQGPANHFSKAESRGGWLTLTRGTLSFRSHGKNIQNHPVDIALHDVAEAVAARTFGLIPNGLEVKLRNNHKEKFVVSDRKTWIRELKDRLDSSEVG